MKESAYRLPETVLRISVIKPERTALDGWKTAQNQESAVRKGEGFKSRHLFFVQSPLALLRVHSESPDFRFPTLATAAREKSKLAAIAAATSSRFRAAISAMRASKSYTQSL